MSQGLPPPPTCRHIVGGFLLFILLCIAFFALPNVVKWGGAILTFIPARLGLMEVVAPDEVVPVHMGKNPTTVDFEAAGKFALFTSNYDLLSINDAVVAAKSKPWIRIVGSAGRQIEVSMVERGMALFDTPFASGRPVVRFEIPASGPYQFFHPTRDDFVYIVPDYTGGREGQITFWMLAQLGLIGAASFALLQRRAAARRPPALPRPTAESRAKYVREVEERADAGTGTASPIRRPWAPPSASAAAPTAQVPPEQDLLLQLRDGLVSTQEAEAQIDRALLAQGRAATDWSDKIGLSRPEAAAYAQGASVAELVRFRYDGWPDRCAKCGQALEYQDLRWWFQRDESGATRLRHIECPTTPAG